MSFEAVTRNVFTDITIRGCNPGVDRLAVFKYVREIVEVVAHQQHDVIFCADALTPRALHPAFYGSYDWHSAVHGHWLLVRVESHVGASISKIDQQR